MAARKKAPKRQPVKQDSAKQPGKTAFAGFSKDTLRFLAGLERNNNKTWFEKNRADYDAHYVAPALSFVATLGPRLAKLSKTLQFEPRVNGSLFRVNRDVRFSKDKTPYKAHIDLMFWEGDRRGGSSSMFFRLEPKRLTLGAGMHGFDAAIRARYHALLESERSGAALSKLLEKLEASGPYRIEGATRKKPPRGVSADHPRAALYLHDGLSAQLEGKPPKEVHSAAFVDWCAAHYKAMAPLHRWLVQNF